MTVWMNIKDMPAFIETRSGSEPGIFLPKRAHPGDAGHDVRIFVEEAIQAAVVDQIAFELVQRATDASFWASNKVPLHNRKPIVEENMNQYKTLESWVKYLTKSLDAFRSSMAGKKAVVLVPGASVVLPAGFKVALPLLDDPETMVMKIVGRSGWAGVDRLCVTNSPGIIDARYRDEVFIALENRSPRVQILENEARVGQALFEIGLSLDTLNLVGQEKDFLTLGRGGKGSTGV